MFKTGKVKVVPVPFFLTEHHVEGVLANRVTAHPFLTSALGRSECQLHAPVALPQDKQYVSHWIRSWVGPIASLDTVVKIKFPAPA